MIPWLRIHLLDDIEDTTTVISAKRASKFIAWKKEEQIVLFCQDQAILSWQQQLSVLQSLDRQHPDHLVDNRVSIQPIILMILRSLLLDALNLHTGFGMGF
jgi:hypothetical protein